MKTNHAPHKDLEKERKDITKQWAKRNEQIERVMQATVGMHGDMQGIAVKTLQEMKAAEAQRSQKQRGKLIAQIEGKLVQRVLSTNLFMLGGVCGKLPSPATMCKKQQHGCIKQANALRIHEA